MKRIHTPSILIGALLGLCVVLSMGGRSDDGGQYQIAASDGDVFILDTTTGHIWSRSGITGEVWDFGTPDRPIMSLRRIHRILPPLLNP